MGVYLSDYTGAQIDAAIAHATALNPTHNDTFHTGTSKRATAGGVAGVNSSNVILSQHMPGCLQEIYINGKQLSTTGYIDNDIWEILASSPTSAAYATRTLTLKSGTGAITAARAVMPYTHAITDHFLEIIVGYAGYTNGEGGTRNTFIGFAQSLAALPTAQAVGFTRDNTNDVSYIMYGSTSVSTVALSTLPLGRNLQATDVITIRLETSEAGSAINTAKFFVNGILQYTTTSIPTVSVYAGCGVYNGDTDVTTQAELSINYFGFKRMI
jgi:hypothetical protein